METTQLELKYCERCGTLKLRPVASGTLYCRPCELLLARFTIPRAAAVTHFSKLPSPPEMKILAGIPLAVPGAGVSGRAQ